MLPTGPLLELEAFADGGDVSDICLAEGYRQVLEASNLLEGMPNATTWRGFLQSSKYIVKRRSRFWSWRPLPMAVTLGTSILLKSISKFSRLATSVITIWQTMR